MEEWVGKIWGRAMTRAARTDYPEAAVTLEEVRQSVAVMFRAMGGAGGLRVEAATETAHGARRRLFSRIAGTDRTIELAWRDEETLRLPMRIAWFPERELNRQLYIWLAALAAVSDGGPQSGDWVQRNAAATAVVLQNYPGLDGMYRRLVEAHLQQRPDPASLRPDEAACETHLRNSLLAPGAGPARLPPAARPACYCAAGGEAGGGR